MLHGMIRTDDNDDNDEYHLHALDYYEIFKLYI